MSFVSTITLPPSIEDVIAKKLENTDSAKWIQRALVLSDKYRHSHKTENHSEYEDEVFIEEANDVLGYLALRSPSTYAQLFSALCNIAEMLPSWQPLSILDIGSGPGTALWAASEIWPSLTTGTCIERDYNFCKMGKEISQSSLPHPMELEWLSADIASSQLQLDKQYDLVILGNVLNEIESVKRNALLEFASAHYNGVLLVVESGTPYGCEVVQQASTKMNSLEGVFLAPYIENSLVVSPPINSVSLKKSPALIFIVAPDRFREN